MSHKKPTYEELENSLAKAEALIAATRNGEVETGTADQNPLLLRLRETNEALRESEEKYRSLVEGTGAIIFSVNQRGRFTYVNEAGIKALGYSQEEILGRFYLSFVYSEDKRRVHKIFLKQLEEGIEAANVELRFVNKEGAVGWFIFLVNLIKKNGEIIGLRGVAQDITERKRAEEALREINEKIRNIVEHSTNLFYSHTPEHVLTYMSPQTRDFLDCEPEEAMIRWTEFVTDNPINEIGFNNTVKAIETGEKQPPYELELIGKKGRIIWVEVNEAPIIKDGKTFAIVGALTDITKRKRAEEALRESEQRFRHTIENLGEGIIVGDLNEIIVLCNPAVEEIFGVPPGELLGKNLVDFMSEDSGEIIRAQTEERIEGKRSKYEIEIVRPNGERRQVLITANPWKDENSNVIGAYGIFRDITERKKLEEEREKLVKELQEALAKVKTLSGFIPICASCKKIRDDEGFWEEVEVYIRDHSEAEFSHGICPDCLQKLYGDFLDDGEKK